MIGVWARWMALNSSGICSPQPSRMMSISFLPLGKVGWGASVQPSAPAGILIDNNLLRCLEPTNEHNLERRNDDAGFKDEEAAFNTIPRDIQHMVSPHWCIMQLCIQNSPLSLIRHSYDTHSIRKPNSTENSHHIPKFLNSGKKQRNNVSMNGLERHDVPRMSNLPFCRNSNSKNRWKCWGMCSIVWIQQRNPPLSCFPLQTQNALRKQSICSKNTHFRIQIWRKVTIQMDLWGAKASQP